MSISRRTLIVAGFAASAPAILSLFLDAPSTNAPTVKRSMGPTTAPTATSVPPATAAPTTTTPATTAPTTTTSTSTTTTTTTPARAGAGVDTGGVVGTETVPGLDPLPGSFTTPAAASPTRRNGELGWMHIPAIWSDARQIFDGVDMATLNRGPGHWPGTPMPGDAGNSVFGGHRTSHGGPFRHLDRLAVGDRIVFATDTGEHVYLVSETFIVGPTDVWIVDSTGQDIVTLFACHPVGSTRQRIIVRGVLER